MVAGVLLAAALLGSASAQQPFCYPTCQEQSGPRDNAYYSSHHDGESGLGGGGGAAPPLPDAPGGARPTPIRAQPRRRGGLTPARGPQTTSRSS